MCELHINSLFITIDLSFDILYILFNINNMNFYGNFNS